MPNHPTGVLPRSYRKAVRPREHRDGYRVIRTWLYATPNEGMARKTLGHLSFMASSVLLGWRASGPAEVVVVSSPTFFSILSGLLLARLERGGFRADLLRRGVPPEKVHTIRNGVDLGRFTPAGDSSAEHHELRARLGAGP